MEATHAAAARARKPSFTLGERRKERCLSSDRRRSGPKAELKNEVGRAGRRRLSEDHRRRSKCSKAASLRRERGELRPPLAGHRGIGRASLPGRLPQRSTAVATAEAAVAAAAGAAAALEDGFVAMEQDKEDVNDGSWTPDMVAEAAEAILGNDRHQQIRYLRWLRVALSVSEKPPAENVVRAGLLPRLVEFLRQTDCAELRPEALCALTNIASTACTKAVATEPETLPTLIALLSSPDLFLREQSAWCLGNIAADGLEMRDLVLGVGALEPLLGSLAPSQHGSTSLIRTGTWALNNLCRRLPPPPLSTVVPVIEAVRPVIEAANTADAATLVDAGWVLYHITRAGSDRVDAVLSAGLLPMMNDMLLHDEPKVVRPVIRAMDNLACSSAAHRGALIEAGVLDPLVETLGNDSAKVRADALRLLSCIAAGSPDQVAAVASTTDVVPSVVTELEEGSASCRREAAWVFLNMCECGRRPGEDIVPAIVRCGGIAAICGNLDKDSSSDTEGLLVMLSLLYTILSEAGPKLAEYTALVEEADGFDRTLALANDHDDMAIYDKAMEVIQSFADRDDDGDSDDDEDDAEDDAEDGIFGSSSRSAGAGVRAPGSPDNSASGDVDGDGDHDMLDDSLSDDSFHMELADTSGPITPPNLRYRSPTAAAETLATPPGPPAAVAAAAPPAPLPAPEVPRGGQTPLTGTLRQPLGAVQRNPVARDDGSMLCPLGASSGGEARGLRAKFPTAGGTGAWAGARERKPLFRESEGDKTE